MLKTNLKKALSLLEEIKISPTDKHINELESVLNFLLNYSFNTKEVGIFLRGTNRICKAISSIEISLPKTKEINILRSTLRGIIDKRQEDMAVAIQLDAEYHREINALWSVADSKIED